MKLFLKKLSQHFLNIFLNDFLGRNQVILELLFKHNHMDDL